MYTVVNNQTIYYQKVGKGPDMVLLHGWKQDVSTFWPLLDGLRDHFTLWLLDLPGFGRSELPKKPFSVKDYSEVVKGFIENQKIDRPVILGHSLGGRVAIKLASHFPHLIDRVILEDAAGIKPRLNTLKIIFFIFSKVVKNFLPNIFGLKTKLRYSVYRSIESDYLEAGELQDTFTKIINEDLTPELYRIQNETLILWGEKDIIVSLADGKKMYRCIQNARIEVIEGVGHFPHLENPQRFLYFLNDFLL